MPNNLPLRLTDYLELVAWTGRAIHEDKRGRIDQSLEPILDWLAVFEGARLSGFFPVRSFFRFLTCSEVPAIHESGKTGGKRA